MPAATTKADLIAATEKEWDKLQRLLDAVPEDGALSRDDDGWSIKDVVSHRAHWIGLFFQWFDAGDAAEMPDTGVKWSELKPYNQGLIMTYDAQSWPQARAWLSDQHARLLALLTATDDDALYGAPMPGGNGTWTTGRYAEAAGPSHYRSAAKFLRARLKSLAQGG